MDGFTPARVYDPVANQHVNLLVPVPDNPVWVDAPSKRGPWHGRSEYRFVCRLNGRDVVRAVVFVNWHSGYDHYEFAS